jgi:hypothetical protein
VKYAIPMLAIAALTVAYPAVGGETPQDIDDKIAEIDAKMAEWAQLKDDLIAVRDDMRAVTDAAEKPGWEDNLKVNGYFQMRARAPRGRGMEAAANGVRETREREAAR